MNQESKIDNKIKAENQLKAFANQKIKELIRNHLVAVLKSSEDQFEISESSRENIKSLVKQFQDTELSNDTFNQTDEFFQANENIKEINKHIDMWLKRYAYSTPSGKPRNINKINNVIKAIIYQDRFIAGGAIYPNLFKFHMLKFIIVKKIGSEAENSSKLLTLLQCPQKQRS